MKVKLFTEEQIIEVLRKAKAGSRTMELCQRHGISDALFYNKAKYMGMRASEVRWLK